VIHSHIAKAGVVPAARIFAVPHPCQFHASQILCQISGFAVSLSQHHQPSIQWVYAHSTTFPHAPFGIIDNIDSFQA